MCTVYINACWTGIWLQTGRSRRHGNAVIDTGKGEWNVGSTSENRVRIRHRYNESHVFCFFWSTRYAAGRQTGFFFLSLPSNQLITSASSQMWCRPTFISCLVSFFFFLIRLSLDCLYAELKRQGTNPPAWKYKWRELYNRERERKKSFG